MFQYSCAIGRHFSGPLSETPATDLRHQNRQHHSGHVRDVQSAPTEQEQGHDVHLHNPSSPDLPSCNCVDWRRHRLPCKHILAIVAHAEGWKSLPLYYRSIRQFSLDPVTAPTEEADTVHAPQGPTVGTQSPASDQPNDYTEEPSVGTQSPASDQPTAYTEEPSVGTQYPASDQPTAYTEEPTAGTQSPASDQPTAYTEEPSVGTQSPACLLYTSPSPRDQA